MIALLGKQDKKEKAYKASTYRKKGLTLVELIVSLAIISLVLTVAYSMYGYNQRSYNVIDSRVDTQQDFRLLMDYLKKQIGTANEIQMLSSVQATVPANYRTIYVNTVNGKGTLNKKEGSNASPVYTYNIPGMTVQFVITGSVSIKITLSASGNIVLEKEIFAQNAPTSSISGTTGTVYNIICLKPVD